jgi:hypothetical protein
MALVKAGAGVNDPNPNGVTSLMSALMNNPRPAPRFYNQVLMCVFRPMTA